MPSGELRCCVDLEVVDGSRGKLIGFKSDCVVSNVVVHSVEDNKMSRFTGDICARTHWSGFFGWFELERKRGKDRSGDEEKVESGVCKRQADFKQQLGQAGTRHNARREP